MDHIDGLNLRLALLDRSPIFFVNSSTLKPDGVLSKYFYDWALIFYQGFNMTWYNGGTNNYGCNRGVCHQLAQFIQLNGSDMDQLATSVTLYDSVYPNLTFSPPVDEKSCYFLTYYRYPYETSSSLDCLTSLKTISPTVALLLIVLFIFVKLLPFFVHQHNKKLNFQSLIKLIVFDYQYYRKSSSSSTIGLTSICFSIILTFFQLWYSVSFQTDLTVTKSAPPVTDFQDLIDRNLTANTIQINPCQRGIELLDEDDYKTVLLSHIEPHYSSLTFTKTINDTLMFVLLAGRWEVNAVKRQMEIYDLDQPSLGIYYDVSTTFGAAISTNLMNSLIETQLLNKLNARTYQLFESRVAVKYHKKASIGPTYTYLHKTSTTNDLNLKIHFNQLTINNFFFYFVTLFTLIAPISTSILIVEMLIHFISTRMDRKSSSTG